MRHIELTNHEFVGRIVHADHDEWLDPTQQGRYRVHIHELMPHMPETEGIWCRNITMGWKISHCDIDSYGSYYPLQEKTRVVVQFFADDYNSGYISSIVPTLTNEDCEDCPQNIFDENRDERYIIYVTKHKSSYIVNDMTTANSDADHPQMTRVINHNDEEFTDRDGISHTETVVTYDRDGILMESQKSTRVDTPQDLTTNTKRDTTINTGRDLTSNTENNTDINTSKDLKITTMENSTVYTRKIAKYLSDQKIEITAPVIEITGLTYINGIRQIGH